MHTINFNMKRFSFYIFATILSTTLFFSCNKDEGINIFSIQDDKDLGMQTAAQIAADPAQFPILDPEGWRLPRKRPDYALRRFPIPFLSSRCIAADFSPAWSWSARLK